ncbi:MAG TPA: indolepyruvate oxidoreductase subunit beta family protein [Rhodopila sp.]
MERPITIAVLAIGGQGGGVLVDWIVALAEREGWRAQSTSVPGVAQRTGATIYYVEMIAAVPGREPVFSAMAAPGDVDIVIASEWMEAGRAIQRGLVTPDRTTLIASTHRTFAVSEKSEPGDGAADSGAVTAAGQAAARRFVAFDMATLAEQAGSVVSSVLFGALCASSVLPFGRAAFEAVIAEAGVGVQGSLRGFVLGFDGVGAPAVAPPAVAEPGLRPVGHPGYDALLVRAAALPTTAHAMLAEGLRHVVAYQDIAYGATYLDLVESLPVALTDVAAKYIARAMVYDDVIRVACLKTQASRASRIQREMGGEIVATTEFMHPRMAELLGLLTPGLGRRLERKPRLVGWVDRVLCGPRQVRTDRIGGFLLLYLVAGLRGWRRHTLRHAREWQRIETWLAAVRAAPDPAFAAELLANQRLIKGYSDTHARGMDKFARVSAAAERLRGRSDAAAWVRRLREAALKDEGGTALDEALRTVDSFIEERVPA